MFRLRTAIATGVIVGLVTYGAEILIILLTGLHDPWSDRFAALCGGIATFFLYMFWKWTVSIHAQMVEDKLHVVREVDGNIRDALNTISLVQTDKRIEKAVYSIVNELDRLTVAHEVSATFHAMLIRWLRGERRSNGSGVNDAQSPPAVDRRRPSRAEGERKHVD